MTTQPETVSDLFPSRWLAPADLRGRSVTLTITAITVEHLHNLRTHQPEPKAILDFGRSTGCARHSRLPLNRTQCLALASIAGSDNVPVGHAFADWPGLRVTLSPATAPNGKPTIRIPAALPAPAGDNGTPPPVEPSPSPLRNPSLPPSGTTSSLRRLPPPRDSPGRPDPHPAGPLLTTAPTSPNIKPHPEHRAPE